jgi:hypothetical protein
VSTVVRSPRYAVLCLALLGLACTDVPTAADERATEETLVVSVVGVADDDAGIVLRLSGSIQTVEPARASLEVGWAVDDTGGATIVVIGPLAVSGDLLLVTRRATPDPLRADVIEVSGAEGELSTPSSVRATVQPLMLN